MGKWTELLRWYRENRRLLPWREAPTPYGVWVSEIMLQQTQVATVIPYYQRFMERFPTVGDLAAGPEAEVLRLWAGLGYYSRARNLQRGARALAGRLERGEGWPQDVEGWLEVPGVGPYTAGAVVSIALNREAAILDGNVERVLSRLQRMVDSGTGKRALWELAAQAVAEARAGGGAPRDFNQALMELGATLCSPRSPKCGACPLAEGCAARAAGDMEAFPPKKPRKEWLVVREVAHCLVNHEGRVWLERRPEGQWRAGLWDLPLSLPQMSTELLGEIETRYVVTRHKVTRLTRVYRLRDPADWRASEPAGASGAWVSLEADTPVAIGAPLRKGWLRVRSEFPGVLARS
ncbi:MAG: A/G-specific adenine glycosylase [Bdellovibrionales bacterium]|nr:A/G-specific adenine glycosylase [Bdellovibrionales bacterium]